MSAAQRSPLAALDAMTEIALLYRRVSKDEQADAGRVSLQTQDEDGRTYISHRPRARLLMVYTDIETGRRDDRVEYQKMLAQVRAETAAGRRVIVVVAALARLGRRMMERVRAWEELKALGVTVHSVREGGQVSEVMYNIMSSLAQEEVRLLSERISRSNKSYRDHGWVKPGGCRWGYRWRPATEIELAAGSPSIVLEEDPETGPYLRELFERAERGESINSLARWTATLPAEARGRGQNGAPRVLSYAGIRQILRAPVYVARQGTFDEDVLDRSAGRWPSLVSDEQWARIHGMPWRHKTRAAGDGRYPLTGLLWCSACRTYRMGGRTIKPRIRSAHGRLTALRREYACTGHIYGSRCQMVIPAALVEQQVIDTLTRILRELMEPAVGERARAISLADARSEARQLSGSRLGALRTELTRHEALLTESWIQSTDGRLTPTAFATIQARLSPEIERLGRAIAELEQAMPKREVRVDAMVIEMVIAGASAWIDALDQASEDESGRAAIHAAASVLVDRIWAVRTGRGQYRLEVLYTETGLAVLKMLAASERAEYVEMYYTANALYQATTSISAAL
jgi:DNA invertase Pin-like site-specific DNA recombinase